MYHFVYRTENIITGEFYIGKHSTSNKNDNYLGSGIRLKNSIKKHGKNSFYRYIIKEFDSETKAYDFEEMFLKEHIDDEKCLNLTSGGRGIQEHYKSKVRRKRDQLGKNNPMYGRTGILSPNYGKKLSDEHKNKISNNSPLKGKTGKKHNRSKQYRVYFQDNSIQDIESMNSFCNSKGYCRVALHHMLTGKYKKHKNIVKIEEISCQQ